MEVLIPRYQIDSRVRGLAHRISLVMNVEKIVILGVLEGARQFAQDLTAFFGPTAAPLQWIKAKSYDGAESTGRVRFSEEDLPDVRDKAVLLIEDIADSGRTLNALCAALYAAGARHVQIVVLLNKPTGRTETINHAMFTGFEIPGDAFVVGYGLDYNEQHRELRDICLFKPA